MKRKGITVQKRQNCDDFVENFRKKLKINLGLESEYRTEVTPNSPVCSALILYKEPTPAMPELPKEVLEKLKREMRREMIIPKVVLPNEQMKILLEEVDEEVEVDKERAIEKDIEMEVD